MLQFMAFPTVCQISLVTVIFFKARKAVIVFKILAYFKGNGYASLKSSKRNSFSNFIRNRITMDDKK